MQPLGTIVPFPPEDPRTQALLRPTVAALGFEGRACGCQDLCGVSAFKSRVVWERVGGLSADLVDCGGIGGRIGGAIEPAGDVRHLGPRAGDVKGHAAGFGRCGGRELGTS